MPLGNALKAKEKSFLVLKQNTLNKEDSLNYGASKCGFSRTCLPLTLSRTCLPLALSRTCLHLALSRTCSPHALSHL